VREEVDHIRINLGLGVTRAKKLVGLVESTLKEAFGLVGWNDKANKKKPHKLQLQVDLLRQSWA